MGRGSLMDAFLAFLEPNSLFQILMVLGVLVILYLMLSGKVKSIGKGGLTFNSQAKFDELASSLRESFNTLKTEVYGFRSDLSLVKTDVASLKADVSVIKVDLANLHTHVETLEKDFQGFSVRTDRSITAISDDFKESSADRLSIRVSITEIRSELRDLKDESRRINRELLKTQILMEEIPFEQKLELYRQYKAIGGNGWLDYKFEEFKKKNDALRASQVAI